MATPEPYPKYVELPAVVEGDTWPGFRVGPFRDVTNPEVPVDPSDTIGSVETAIWRLARITDPVVNTVYTAHSNSGEGDGEIAINDAGIWDVRVLSQILRTGTEGNWTNVPAGGYYWSLTFELSNNEVYTFYNGYLRITPRLPSQT